ncbi:5492_t:CDS:2 [Funneliformis caledonium]|uniref:D-arabinono-1,4-lactone oxidase n=1 Tax=Funneliformis caledonium TaxID=1117310 RepID=A0A9N9C373_9GLOM|nr:5492_t:CDS:2 [Funneliformis caledonium]
MNPLDTIKQKIDTLNQFEDHQKDEKGSILKEIDEFLGKITKPMETREQRFKDLHIPPSVERLEPKNEEEIQKIIQDAYNDKEPTIVRVIGASHSLPSAILTARDIPKNVKAKLISLTKFRGVVINDAEQIATALAGTNLGQDLENEDSTIENGLLYQLNQRGYSLPDTGGIIHQTVGGFISTGSSGGSVIHSLFESIIGIRIIDGTGKIHDLKMSDTDNSKFLAVGVSMGLMGIITKVTFKLDKKFFITGTQTISPIKPLSRDINVGAPIDMFGDGDKDQQIPSLLDFFSNSMDFDAEFNRILWWPQDGVDRLTIWKAKKILTVDGTDLPVNPYELFPEVLNSQVPAQLAASLILKVLNLAQSPNKVFKKIAVFLYAAFNPIGSQSFQDIWWSGLPMDDKLDSKILPVAFSEFWLPLDKSKEVMNDLQQLFKNNPESIGNMFVEIYCAKKSPFWLNPSYETDSVRFDFTYNLGDPCGTPEEHYNYYWKILKKHTFRCHWGKYKPEYYNKRIPSLYPKFKEWMDIREELDPKQIFPDLTLKQLK